MSWIENLVLITDWRSLDRHLYAVSILVDLEIFQGHIRTQISSNAAVMAQFDFQMDVMNYVEYKDHSEVTTINVWEIHDFITYPYA